MRDVEFLPSWYVDQRRGAERRAAQRRVVAAALGCGAFMSAAVLALARPASPDRLPACAPAAVDTRRPLLSAAVRAVGALTAAVPAGVDVTGLAVQQPHRPGSDLVVEVRGAGRAQDVAAFIASLRRLQSFKLADATVDSTACTGTDSFTVLLHIDLSGERTKR